ncbi:MAG: hypothetical protein V4805_11170 [Pseudomonadota bacterium]
MMANMPRRKKIVVGFITFITLIGGVALYGLLLLPFSDTCSNTVLAEYPSPNGKLKAIVFERSCGATTDFSTQVSILNADKDFDSAAGKLFVADTNQGQAPAGVDGGPDIRFRWLSDTSAEIEHASLVGSYLREAKIMGVKVKYVLFP